jgi:hypothetical protein
MLLQQYASPGTQWAFQRDNKTFATCVVLESDIKQSDHQEAYTLEATLLIGDQIAHIYAHHVPPCDETAPFYIWLESDGEFFNPKEVDCSYMIPFDHVLEA